MTFMFAIVGFICFGLSHCFVLHPPSRVYNDDDGLDEDGPLPVVPLTPTRSSDDYPSSHPNPSGYSVACNVTLCDGSSALNNSCCHPHSKLLQSWLGVLGLMAAVVVYAMIAYCYMWRRNRNHQLHNHNRGHTYSDSSDYNPNNQYTPPPEYTGVLADNDVAAEEAAPPTYEEAMNMTAELQGRRVSSEQYANMIRVQERGKKLPRGQSDKRISLDAIARKFRT